MSIEETPFKFSKRLKMNFNIIIPEGWCFFTKNPREPYIYLFEANNEYLTKDKNFPNSSYNNYFGLIRKQKVFGLEYAMISKNIPDTLWQKTNGEDIEKLYFEGKIREIRVSNPHTPSNLCGDYIFAELEPVPYAWHCSRKQFTMPGKILKVKVICK